MKIDRALLDKIAHLSRLEFEEKDAEKMMKDMTAIVDWVEKLKEVNTDGVEPLTTMSHEINVLREDEVKPHMSHEDALLNAPKKDADYFRVPKVLE
jgi:aspartyl-tRNA(Asn)/glutamyl-tRNA(Gln) amidotransferase subunit C